MDNERVILHSDMNSFYASVEMMLNPELKGKPVAVCGSTEERHGIVLAKSDLAKKAGVKTGMVNWEARQLCPGLVVVPPQYDQYLKYSKLARQIYHRYTDLVEPYGMDECWLDVTVLVSAERAWRSPRQSGGQQREAWPDGQHRCVIQQDFCQTRVRHAKAGCNHRNQTGQLQRNNLAS